MNRISLLFLPFIFTQQIFPEGLLHVRLCSRCQENIRAQNKGLCSREAYPVRGDKAVNSVRKLRSVLGRVKCCSNRAEEKGWGVKGWESYSFKQALLKK